MAVTDYPRTRGENTAGEQSLYSVTEIVRGSAASVLQRAVELQQRLCGPRSEKTANPLDHPERTHSTPDDILLNAYDDLRIAESILESLNVYVGEAGSAPR